MPNSPAQERKEETARSVNKHKIFILQIRRVRESTIIHLVRLTLMHRVEYPDALRRLETPVDDNGALAQRDAPAAVGGVQPPEIQRREADEADDGEEEDDVGAKAAGVGRGLIGGEEQGADDVACGGANEDEGGGGFALGVAGCVLGGPGVNEGC